MTELVRKFAPSLAARDARVERTRLVAAARADVTLIKKRKAQIAEAFYEIGKALRRLHCDPIPKLLGFGTFARLCVDGLGLSVTTARRLMLIAERVSRDNALRWGKEKAAALVDLAIAAGDSGPITKKNLALDPDSATTREIRAEAKRRRAQREKRHSRGRTVAPADNAIATKLEEALRRGGIGSARVVAVASRPGAPAFLRIDRLPCNALRGLRKALSECH